MHPLRTATAVASLLLLSVGCASASDPSAAGGPPPAEAPAGQASPAAAAPAVTAGATLLATVGTEQDPEAYEIALTTEDGTAVASLPAGDYTIRVTDHAQSHNFALRGEGVDEATSVPQVEEVVFEVTLAAGEYTYVCDPHPGMTGTVQVT